MFTGREYDAETGLYHYRERSYSPQIGRFLQTDPVGACDENRYTYCYDNPVNLVDPYGLVAMDAVLVPGVSSGVANPPVANSGSLEAGTKIKPASTDVTDQYFKNADVKKTPKRKQVGKKYPTRKIAEDARDARGKPGGKANKPERHGDGPWHFHDKNHNDPSKPNIHYIFPG